ncbi:hypothetical protein ACJIZ3_021376 [Penstemon smallii]|uniref:Transposase n=1 Tax=Penstemon smallii TaxID=265156 RepID=A0ABD3SL89_9LAMI
MWRPLSDKMMRFILNTIFNPTFQLKQVFNTRKQFREAVHSHVIMTMRNIKITSNDKTRVYAKCMAEGCKWRINALRVKDEATYQIKEYEDKHVCSIDSHYKNINSRWLAKKYEELFRLDPNRNVKGFRVEAVKEIKCHVSATQAYRAKKKALEAIQENPDDQFAQLWDYGNELRERNPRSTVILKQSEEGSSTCQRKYDRFYVGFKALSQGFNAGCRPIIGVDGTHLRGTFEGVFLTAVSFDPNNQLYPVEYALVQTESTDAWEWFLDDCYTFMSDKQKDLLKAFERVFPGSDNRFCVRHLIGNMKQGV